MFQVYFENLIKRHEKILSSNEYGDTTTWIVKLIEMHNQHHIESNEESFHFFFKFKRSDLLKFRSV